MKLKSEGSEEDSKVSFVRHYPQFTCEEWTACYFGHTGTSHDPVVGSDGTTGWIRGRE